jgi:putative N6-adenine-specific DNA methylase
VKPHRIFAIAAPGLEGVLEKELRSTGIANARAVQGGVELEGATDAVMRVNLWSRIASRVVVRLDEFHASSFHELERRAKRTDWRRFIPEGGRALFRVTCRKSRLYHSDAVAERLVEAAGVEPDEVGQLFVARLAHDVLTISVDSSGELLHRRGYRQAVAKAPLRETLAAAMLAGCEWIPEEPLVDPMCGSGTIPIEAAMIARRIAPGLERDFAFASWPGHDPVKWTAMKEAARNSESARAPSPIVGSDRDSGAIEAARANAGRARVADDVRFDVAPVSGARYPQPPGWIVTNPPYGERIGGKDSLRNLYAQIGSILRGPASGYQLALLSADRALESATGLDLAERFRTANGGIPVRLVTG